MANINKPKQNGVAKVPVILQLEMLECGAACLAMVLAYYNKWVPLEQVRSDCAVNRNGSVASNIIKAAKDYGLDYKAYKMEPKDLKKQGTFPCIIHWGFNHFVVLDGFRGNHAIINDPARGRIKVTLDEFDREFTGIVLMFEPSANFKPTGNKVGFFGYLSKALGNYRAESIIILICTLVASILGLAFLSCNRVFIDSILDKNNNEWFENFIGLFFVLVILAMAIHCFLTNFNNKSRKKIETVNSANYFWKVLHLPMRFFEQRMSDEIAHRLSSNKSIAFMIVDIIIPIIASAIMLLVYAFLLYFQYPWLPLLGIAGFAINALIAAYSNGIRENLSRIELRDVSNLQSYTLSGAHMIEEIKATGAEVAFVNKWKSLQKTVIDDQSQQMKKLRISSVVPEIIKTFLNVLILALGVYFIVLGKEDASILGYIFFVQGLMQLFFDPITQILKFRSTCQSMSNQIDKIEDVLNYENDHSFDNSTSIYDSSEMSGQVTMNNVTFGYSTLDEPVLQNFSLDIAPGSKVAICGASGSGKSTVTKLLANMYKPWKGDITFDGWQHSQINRDVFLQSVSVVEQDVSLIEGSIANNIKMWDETISDAQMTDAAIDACIHDEIMMMRGGYQHIVFQGGKDISGGQKQRIEIARALAKNPKICILDEATSSLDAQTENDVINAINARGITCIVVAHRLSTIRNCDEIIVLDKGEIVERGTHSQLMELDGYYAGLVENG